MKHQLKLWKVTIYEKNPNSDNDIARVEVIMLDVDGFSVMKNAKQQMGYSAVTETSVEELEGPFDSGYLISYKSLTDMPQATRPKTATSYMSPGDVIAEFEALFSDD